MDVSERILTEFDDVLARLEGGANPTASDIQALSDLDAGQKKKLAAVWGRVPATVRTTVVTDAIAVSDDSVHVEFSRLAHVALSDEEPGVRLMAVEMLRETLDWASARKLEAVVKADSDESVSAAAAEVLGTFVLGIELNRIDETRGRTIVATLRAVAADQDQPMNVRAAAIESLGACSQEWVEGVILDALYEEEAPLRLASIRAMGASANKKWLEYLVDQIASDDAQFREEAAVAVDECLQRATDRAEGLRGVGEPPD